MTALISVSGGSFASLPIMHKRALSWLRKFDKNISCVLTKFCIIDEKVKISYHLLNRFSLLMKFELDDTSKCYVEQSL